MWLLLLVACTGGPEPQERTEAEKEAIREDLQSLIDEADALDRVRHEGAWEAHEELRPGDAPCPVPLEELIGPEPTDPAMPRLGVLENTTVISRRDFVGYGEFRMQLGQLEYDVKNKIDGTYRDTDWLASRIDEHAFRHPDHDLLLLVERRIDPQVVDDERFGSGLLVGMLYAWSYADEAVVCAAPVGATSSASVVTREDPLLGQDEAPTQASLHGDLVQNAVETAAPELKAVAPVE